MTAVTRAARSRYRADLLERAVALYGLSLDLRNVRDLVSAMGERSENEAMLRPLRVATRELDRSARVAAGRPLLSKSLLDGLAAVEMTICFLIPLWLGSYFYGDLKLSIWIGLPLILIIGAPAIRVVLACTGSLPRLVDWLYDRRVREYATRIGWRHIGETAFGSEDVESTLDVIEADLAAVTKRASDRVVDLVALEYRINAEPDLSPSARAALTSRLSDVREHVKWARRDLYEVKVPLLRRRRLESREAGPG